MFEQSSQISNNAIILERPSDNNRRDRGEHRQTIDHGGGNRFPEKELGEFASYKNSTSEFQCLYG